MDFATWEPVYEAILADFGYDRHADERARDCLGNLVDDGSTLSPNDVSLDGQTVAIAGAGPSLERELDTIRTAETVFAASTAADRLRSEQIRVDCLVTDLDKNKAAPRSFSDEAIPVAVHAHGDNIPAVRTIVPTLDPAVVLPTTQAEPTAGIHNVGGFTDGDRAAFLADYAGAERLVFAGWDFEDVGVSPEKRRKLGWAERLLYWLECRRGERFGVLDGRRGDIDTTVLPLD